jgi:hypothetical protein
MTKKSIQLKSIFSCSSFHCFSIYVFSFFSFRLPPVFFLAEPETLLILSDTISLFPCPVHHSFPILTFFLTKLETSLCQNIILPPDYLLSLNLSFVQCLIFFLSPTQIRNEDLLSYSHTLTTFTSSQPTKILNENLITTTPNYITNQFLIKIIEIKRAQSEG